MRYTLDDRPFPGSGCHVYDANGLEWFQVIEFDTETGEILRQVTDAENFLLVDPEVGEVLTETVRAAPPLTVKKCEPEARHDPRHHDAGWKYVGCTCPPGCAVVPGCHAHEIARERQDREFDALRVVEVTPAASWQTPPVVWPEKPQR